MRIAATATLSAGKDLGRFIQVSPHITAGSLAGLLLKKLLGKRRDGHGHADPLDTIGQPGIPGPALLGRIFLGHARDHIVMEYKCNQYLQLALDPADGVPAAEVQVLLFGLCDAQFTIALHGGDGVP